MFWIQGWDGGYWCDPNRRPEPKPQILVCTLEKPFDPDRYEIPEDLAKTSDPIVRNKQR